nr:YezD family protein [Niallia circulans]
MVGETNQLDKVKTQLEAILKTMKFGSVTLVIQDGKIIQIEKNEKIRLGK